MWIATISMPVTQPTLVKQGRYSVRGETQGKAVKRDVKLGRIEGEAKHAFAYAQSVFNKHGGKVHSVVKVSTKEAEVLPVPQSVQQGG